VGTLLGTAAQAGFCLGYAAVGPRAGWPAALVAGALGFGALGLALERLAPALPAATALAVGALLVALRAMPRAAAGAGRDVRRPHWDLPARMIVATAVVLALTTLAPRLGPRFTGLLSSFPVYAGILAIFAHSLEGRPAALGVLRGLLVGLWSFAAFFLVVAVLLGRVGLAATFAAAVVTALGVQITSLQALPGRLRRRGSRPAPGA
jgi:hypothetical protein